MALLRALAATPAVLVAGALAAAAPATAQETPSESPTSLVRVDEFGGTIQNERPEDVGSDAEGRVYFAGVTASSDFPTTGGLGIPHDDTNPNDNLIYEQGFVRRYSAGGTLEYSTLLPDVGTSAFAFAPDGSVYATGSQFEPVRADAAGVLKLDASGETVDYQAELGDPDVYTSGADIAVAADGTAYVLGSTQEGGVFPVTDGAWKQTPFDPDADAWFLARLSPAGEMTAATYVPKGTEAIDVSPSGDVIAVGSALRGAFGAVPGTSNAAGGAAGVDGFLAAFKPDLTAVRWASYVGSAGQDSLSTVDVGADGVVHAAGRVAGPALAEVNPLEPPAGSGVRFDAMYVALSPDGQGIRQLARVGGTGAAAMDLEVAPDGATLISGLGGSGELAEHGALPGSSDGSGFAVRIEDAAITHLTRFGDPGVFGDGNGQITGTPDGLIHVGDYVYGGPEHRTFDLRLQTLRMIPFVDEPALAVDARQPVSASLQVEAGAREDVTARATALAKVGKGRSARKIKLRSGEVRASAYVQVDLALKAATPKTRRLLKAALASGKRIRVEAKVRFVDAQGTVATKRRGKTVRGERP